MPIGEYLTSHTHRQHKVFMAWLQLELNHPTKTEAYLMQIACEIRRILISLSGKSPSTVKFTDFSLKYGKQEEPEQKTTAEEATMWAKVKWAAVLKNAPNRKSAPKNAPHNGKISSKP